jgi:A/G-specific adenine glycosylase
VPRGPVCTQCLLNQKCYAYGYKKVGEFPVKIGRLQQRNRFFTYLIFNYRGSTWLRQRIESDIWKGLFEFPMIETEIKTEVNQVMSQLTWLQVGEVDNLEIQGVSDWKVHSLSHQLIHYRVIKLEMQNEISAPINWINVKRQDIHSFAVPKLLEAEVNSYSDGGGE